MMILKQKTKQKKKETKMSRVLTFIGSPAAGKSSLIIQIANKYSKDGKKVLIVSFDTMSSAVTHFVLDKHEISLGTILSKSQLTQDDLLKAMLRTSNNNIAFIGYKIGDFKAKYPRQSSELAQDFYFQLLSLADIVLIDTFGDFSADEAVMFSLDVADNIIAVFTDDTKGVASYKSLTNFIDKPNKTIFVGVGKEETLSSYMKRIDVFMPRCAELNKIMNSGDPFRNEFESKRSLPYLRSVEKLYMLLPDTKTKEDLKPSRANKALKVEKESRRTAGRSGASKRSFFEKFKNIGKGKGEY